MKNVPVRLMVLSAMALLLMGLSAARPVYGGRG